jgi:hypothetical protein
MRTTLIIFIALLTLSCTDEQVDIANMRINHFKPSAVALGPTLAFMSQEGTEIGTDEWKFLYSEIEGFEYEWGYVYDLKVRKEQIENPPQDGSSVRYVLEELISKRRVAEGASFNITLKSETKGIQDLLVMDGNNEYQLGYELSIDCEDLCESLGESLENSQELTGVFTHTNSNTIALKELLFE